MTTELLHTWKVEALKDGAALTINGRRYDLGSSTDAVIFALERAARGYARDVEIENCATGPRSL